MALQNSQFGFRQSSITLKGKIVASAWNRRDRVAIASYRRLLPATGLADCSIGASRRLEEKSLAELLDFERPGNRFSGPFPMRHDCRQKLKVATCALK
jgi:hypothetical protein